MMTPPPSPSWALCACSVAAPAADTAATTSALSNVRFMTPPPLFGICSVGARLHDRELRCKEQRLVPSPDCRGGRDAQSRRRLAPYILPGRVPTCHGNPVAESVGTLAVRFGSPATNQISATCAA